MVTPHRQIFLHALDTRTCQFCLLRAFFKCSNAKVLLLNASTAYDLLVSCLLVSYELPFELLVSFLCVSLMGRL